MLIFLPLWPGYDDVNIRGGGGGMGIDDRWWQGGGGGGGEGERKQFSKILMT